MSNIANIFNNTIAQKLKDNPDLASNINASYMFDLGDSGKWTLDLKKPGGEVIEGPIDDPDLTVTMKPEDFEKLVSGSLNPQMAFMTGKLKIKGDMALALKLQQILG